MRVGYCDINEKKGGVKKDRMKAGMHQRKEGEGRKGGKKKKEGERASEREREIRINCAEDQHSQ